MSGFEFEDFVGSTAPGHVERDSNSRQHERNQSLPNAASIRRQDSQTQLMGRPTRAATFSRIAGRSRIPSASPANTPNVPVSMVVPHRPTLLEMNNPPYSSSSDVSPSPPDELSQQQRPPNPHHHHAASLAMPQSEVHSPSGPHRSVSGPAATIANMSDESPIQNGGSQRQATSKSKVDPKTPSEYALHILFTQVSICLTT
jgi:hypothetical protein